VDKLPLNTLIHTGGLAGEWRQALLFSLDQTKQRNEQAQKGEGREREREGEGNDRFA